MADEKKPKKKRKTETDDRVRLIVKISRESDEILARVREKYPFISSQGHEIDAAIQFWGAFALHFGLDAGYRPLLPEGGGGASNGPGSGKRQEAYPPKLESPRMAS